MYCRIAILLFSFFALIASEGNVVRYCLVTIKPPDSNYMTKVCAGDRGLAPLSEEIDGALLISTKDEDLDCTLTFRTSSVLHRFMLRFDYLALDCNDHLVIYDGDRADGRRKFDLSCRSTRASVGRILTESNFVTIRYTADRWSKLGDGFRLVVTSYKDFDLFAEKGGCRGFLCENKLCVARSLLCDGVNHCGDNSDEKDFCANGDQEEVENELELSLTVYILVVVLLLAGFSLIFTLGLRVYNIK